MYTFENDLSLYDDFDEATEGLKEVIKDKASKGFKGFMNLMHNLKETLKSFGKWLMDKINRIVDIGKKLRNRNKSSNNESDNNNNNDNQTNAEILENNKNGEKLARSIIDDIDVMSDSVITCLNDITKIRKENNVKPETNSAEQPAEVFKIKAKLASTLMRSVSAINKIKDLPTIEMNYDTTKMIYNWLRDCLDTNSKLTKAMDAITAYGRDNLYVDDDTTVSLVSRFVNVHTKLMVCITQLYNKLTIMGVNNKRLSTNSGNGI